MKGHKDKSGKFHPHNNSNNGISKEEMARQLNVLLVNSGVKNKNHRMKAWEKLKGIG